MGVFVSVPSLTACFFISLFWDRRSAVLWKRAARSIKICQNDMQIARKNADSRYSLTIDGCLVEKQAFLLPQKSIERDIKTVLCCLFSSSDFAWLFKRLHAWRFAGIEKNSLKMTLELWDMTNCFFAFRCCTWLRRSRIVFQCWISDSRWIQNSGKG